MSEQRVSVIRASEFRVADYDSQMMSPGILMPANRLDPHLVWLFDEFNQIRLLFNDAIGQYPRIFKDSSDSPLYFSVKSGSWINSSGALQTFTGGINLGPLTNGASNYVYCLDTASTTSDIVISTSAYPSIVIPHLRLGTIIPANGTWYPDEHRDSGLSIRRVGFTDQITCTFGDGTHAITAGQTAWVRVEYPCVIKEVTLLADQVGSIVIDIWKDVPGNYPPTVADTITASAKPTLSSQDYSTDTTLVGWTTTINDRDVIKFKVDSATTVTKVTAVLRVARP